MKPTEFPGRLVVADEGDELVHIDMYRTNALDRMRITVARDTLRLYAENLLRAANAPHHQK